MWYKDPTSGGGASINFTDGDLAGDADLPLVVHVTESSKTLTYTDNVLTMVSDAYGTKTLGYTAGVLTSITGTGKYQSKALTYTGDNLTAIGII